MKSTISVSKGVEGRQYPYLGINKVELIVLFSKPRHGVVVHRGLQSDAGSSNIGLQRTDWMEEAFEIFRGTVHLSM